MSRTITAIATPLAIGSVGIIRISGEKSYEILSKIFKSINNKNPENQKGYTSLYGHIFEDNQIVDEVVVHFYRKPLSYTGEDVIEISCHGGIYILKKVLHLVVKNGAKLAEAGEFTKTAVLNGKMTLTQAEGVMDLIEAQTSQSAKAGMMAREGVLFKTITEIKQNLVAISAHLSAFIDYPEEEIEDINHQDILEKLTVCHEKMLKLTETYDYGSIIKNGVETVIIGKTNAGKSSLMNLLAGRNKSIVTDIAGTTRDIVEDNIQIGDVILNISDTAGIRETDDVVESIGTKLAIDKIATSSLVLAVFDGSAKLDENDINVINNVKNTNCIAIINKSDLVKNIEMETIKENFDNIINISALESQGILELQSQIEELLKLKNIDLSLGLIANERQKIASDEALENIQMGLNSVNEKHNLDAISFNIEMAIQSLLNLTGETVTEEVINGVFSNFCVGK